MAQSYEREHTVSESATSENVLANLSEEQENVQRLRDVKEATVDSSKKIMQLPVPNVATAENSNQWAIEVEHPFEGTLRFYRDAPVTGWLNRPGNIVRVMDWYDIDEDPYHLQVMRIYIQKVGDDADQAHGWELIEPPDYDAPIREQLSRKKKYVKSLRATVSDMTLLMVTLISPAFISLASNIVSLSYIVESFVSVLIVLFLLNSLNPVGD